MPPKGAAKSAKGADKAKAEQKKKVGWLQGAAHVPPPERQADGPATSQVAADKTFGLKGAKSSAKVKQCVPVPNQPLPAGSPLPRVPSAPMRCAGT